MGQKKRSDASLLAGGADVGMTNESDIPHVLNLDVLDPHNSGEDAGGGEVFKAVEQHTGVDLVMEMFSGHVRLGPAIGGDDASIGLRAFVDDGVSLIEVVRRATADHKVQISSADCRMRTVRGKIQVIPPLKGRGGK